MCLPHCIPNICWLMPFILAKNWGAIIIFKGREGPFLHFLANVSPPLCIRLFADWRHSYSIQPQTPLFSLSSSVFFLASSPLKIYIDNPLLSNWFIDNQDGLEIQRCIDKIFDGRSKYCSRSKDTFVFVSNQIYWHCFRARSMTLLSRKG